MQQYSEEEIVRILPKGIMTIPKRFRDALGLKEKSFARIYGKKGRLVIEPVSIFTKRTSKTIQHS